MTQLTTTTQAAYIVDANEQPAPINELAQIQQALFQGAAINGKSTFTMSVDNNSAMQQKALDLKERELEIQERQLALEEAKERRMARQLKYEQQESQDRNYFKDWY